MVDRLASRFNFGRLVPDEKEKRRLLKLAPGEKRQ